MLFPYFAVFSQVDCPCACFHYQLPRAWNRFFRFFYYYALFTKYNIINIYRNYKKYKIKKLNNTYPEKLCSVTKVA